MQINAGYFDITCSAALYGITKSIGYCCLPHCFRLWLLFVGVQKCMILFCQQYKLCYFCTEYTVNWDRCDCAGWQCRNLSEWYLVLNI